MKYTDLIISYSKGDINLDELNRDLAKAKIPMKFDPMANTISDEKLAGQYYTATFYGTAPTDASDLSFGTDGSQTTSWRQGPGKSQKPVINNMFADL